MCQQDRTLLKMKRKMHLLVRYHHRNKMRVSGVLSSHSMDTSRNTTRTDADDTLY